MKYRLFAFNVIPTDTYTTFMVNMINMINMISALKITGRNFITAYPPPPPPATITQFYPSNLQAITYISVKYRLLYTFASPKQAMSWGEGGGLRCFNTLETVYE